MATKNGRYIDKFLKKADSILDDAVEFGSMTAKQAANTSKSLHAQAKKEKDVLTKKGINTIKQGINVAKKSRQNTQNDLDVLERLGKLKKQRVITEKEFQEKKRKILKRI